VNRMDRPSGDQSTCHPSPAPTGPTTFEPSTSATSMRWSPVRFELKAIRVPSGDHDGYSPPSVLGSCLSPVPSGRIRVMIPLDPLGPAKAISAPSGDQAGASPRVKRWWPDPSACMSQISESPLRSERNAIVSPSGDRVQARHVGLHALVQERAQSRRESAPEPLGLKGANVCSVEAGEGVGGQVVITAC